MTRAALIAASDDPVILDFWLRNFAATAASDVDELLVAINGPHAADVADLLMADNGRAEQLRAALPALRLQTYPGRQDHGWCLEQLYAKTDADTLLLLETDAWFRTRSIVSVVADWFAIVESGGADVIGSPRHPASPQLIAAAQQRWGLITVGEDQGTALWPCFLTASRTVLDRTDRLFGARAYPVGQLVPGLGIAFAEETTDETFVGVSWQLRNDHARIRLIPQHRVARGSVCRAEESLWFHTGSLSTAYGMAWGAIENLSSLYGVPQDEMARRFALWRTIADHSEFSEERAVFIGTLYDTIARIGTSGSLIEEWRAFYAPWFARLDDPGRSIVDVLS